MKPNAIFFLEVSYLSQWTALALSLELVYFQRRWRMLFYAIVLLTSFAGTGILLLVISAPVLLSRLSWKSVLVVGLIFAICVGIAIRINWYQSVEQRFTEYQREGASANHRFIEPFVELRDVLASPKFIVSGIGPGNGPKGHNEFWWVSTKMAYEYGVLSALSFIVFLGYCLFDRPPSKRIAFVMFCFLNFMVGFLIPVYPVLMLVSGTLFRLGGEPPLVNEVPSPMLKPPASP